MMAGQLSKTDHRVDATVSTYVCLYVYVITKLYFNSMLHHVYMCVCVKVLLHSLVYYHLQPVNPKVE